MKKDQGEQCVQETAKQKFMTLKKNNKMFCLKSNKEKGQPKKVIFLWLELKYVHVKWFHANLQKLDVSNGGPVLFRHKADNLKTYLIGLVSNDLNSQHLISNLQHKKALNWVKNKASPEVKKCLPNNKRNCNCGISKVNETRQGLFLVLKLYCCTIWWFLNRNSFG